jgi:hypothetical protein
MSKKDMPPVPPAGQSNNGPGGDRTRRSSDIMAALIGSDTPWGLSCRDLPSNWRTPQRVTQCFGPRPRSCPSDWGSDAGCVRTTITI